jgi:hypothetical protein
VSVCSASRTLASSFLIAPWRKIVAAAAVYRCCFYYAKCEHQHLMYNKAFCVCVCVCRGQMAQLCVHVVKSNCMKYKYFTQMTPTSHEPCEIVCVCASESV